MSKRILLGMLTPSSNTSLEPLTSAIVSELPGVSAHFSRFTVTEISLEDRALGQFDDTKVLEAAKLLADARVDVIGWSGTAASWLGFDADEKLCRRITEATGIPATTSVLALNEILHKTGVETLGLISPYLKSVQDKIIENYGRAGIRIPAERHLGLHVNYSFAEVTEAQILEMAGEVAAQRPDAMTVMCTNLKGAQLAARIEEETGIPLYDSVSTVVWKSLLMAGFDVRAVKGWGSLFQKVS
ncbi:aspartate/glutamate racemase family protein [Castellaniella sp. GW247-6E4]|uniref:maleate cis-trans isomerase family protein n=1 Tax=Castellaniella sp. GW247-6E4 TaxID=3140380 RepID=UPI003314F598